MSDTEDHFVVETRQHNEFLERLANSPEDDIFGIVDASCTAGVRRGDEPWRLVLDLAGWKHQTNNLRCECLRAEMCLSKSDLDRYQAEIETYDIIHLKGRVALDPAGRFQAEVTDIISRTYRDPDLEQFAAELQRPVVHTDSELGSFVLDRSINWFKGEALWRGRPVRLALSVGQDLQIDGPLQTAKMLWQNQGEWNERIGEFSVAELLERKNSIWLADDESEVSPEEFKSRMRLVSITVYPNGSFDFWHDDGDLFGGHAIQVGGNLRDGLTDADTPG